MLTIIGRLLIALVLLSDGSQTVTGTVKTNIVTAGGDCAHRWWLQPDASAKQKPALMALEPEDKVPPEIKNRRVRVEGELKVCHGVEGVKVPVIVIHHIEPAAQ